MTDGLPACSGRRPAADDFRLAAGLGLLALLAAGAVGLGGVDGGTGRSGSPAPGAVAGRLEVAADALRVVASNPAEDAAYCRLRFAIVGRAPGAPVSPVDVMVVVPARTSDFVAWRAVGDVAAYRIDADWLFDCDPAASGAILMAGDPTR